MSIYNLDHDLVAVLEDLEFVNEPSWLSKHDVKSIAVDNFNCFFIICQSICPGKEICLDWYVHCFLFQDQWKYNTTLQRLVCVLWFDLFYWKQRLWSGFSSIIDHNNRWVTDYSPHRNPLHTVLHLSSPKKYLETAGHDSPVTVNKKLITLKIWNEMLNINCSRENETKKKTGENSTHDVSFGLLWEPILINHPQQPLEIEICRQNMTNTGKRGKK